MLNAGDACCRCLFGCCHAETGRGKSRRGTSDEERSAGGMFSCFRGRSSSVSRNHDPDMEMRHQPSTTSSATLTVTEQPRPSADMGVFLPML
uniref:Secreted protein n=1 Tax=Mycena chlorophos TaxID=658473 RepID=A0ABQ0LWV3_MYCCL|nr:predicted protein [Mycena chlorophos]